MDLSAWIPTAISLLLAGGWIAGKNWIKASVERSVQYKFDEKIAALQSDLRKNEESFRSALAAREAEISALRENILSGRAHRRALLDQRQIAAVEKIWASVNELAPLFVVSGMMASINFDAAAKETPNSSSARKLFETIVRAAPDPKSLVNPAKNEEPFVSPLAWAYLSAYQAIIVNAYLRAKLLELGIATPNKLLKKDHLTTLLKAALPHHTEFIDKFDAGAYHHLLEEIQGLLLGELRKMLEGADVDQSELMRSNEIMAAVRKVTAENVAEGANGGT